MLFISFDSIFPVYFSILSDFILFYFIQSGSIVFIWFMLINGQFEKLFFF